MIFLSETLTDKISGNSSISKNLIFIPTTVEFSQLLSPISSDLQAVNLLIQRRMQSQITLVNQVLQYALNVQGKQLRPALLILVAKCLGCDKASLNAVYEMGAVIEMIHTATLFHDDVVDDATLRRGRPSIKTQFGNPASVLVGDFIYSRAFQMMVGQQHISILKVLADATNTIAEGEILQLMNVGNTELDEATCLRVIDRKTATLFTAAGAVGAIIAGADDKTIDRMSALGRHLGTAFQLVDDILDYTGDPTHTGKKLGTDLGEGKLTLPVIHTLQCGEPQQRELLLSAITQPTTADFAGALQAIIDSKSLDYTRKVAQRESHSAKDILNDLPAGPYTQTLIELCHFATHRQY